MTEAPRYPREGGILVVSKFDHSRCIRHHLQIIAELVARAVGFRFLTEFIGTTTPRGRRVFRIFGAL